MLWALVRPRELLRRLNSGGKGGLPVALPVLGSGSVGAAAAVLHVVEVVCAVDAAVGGFGRVTEGFAVLA